MIIFYLVAGVVGIIIGYLLKQVQSGKGIQEVESKWSEKVAALTRELDALRAGMKEQTTRAAELEKAGADTLARLQATQVELDKSKEAVTATQRDLAGKATVIKALEAAARDARAQLETGAASATAWEASIVDRDGSIAALKDELRTAGEAREEQEAHVQTLGARIAELIPLEAQVALARQSASEWELRCKTVEAAKDSELSRLRARLSALEPLTGKVKDWESRYAAMLNGKDAALAKLTATVASLETFKGKAEAAVKETAVKNGLIVALRERVAQLEGSREQDRAGSETILNSLRARATDAGPMEHRVQESEHLRMQIQTWDQRFSSAILEKDSQIARLRAENEQLRQQAAGKTGELKLPEAIGPALQ